MKKEFDVYFSGEILEGYELGRVKQAVGELFRLSGPKLEALFAGVPVRVKKNLSVEKAGRFRKVFLESGALVQIVPAGQEPSTEPATPPLARSAATPAREETGGGLELAPMEPLETESHSPQPAIDTSALELASDDGPIASPPPADRPPLPDTSNLSIAPLEDDTPEDKTQSKSTTRVPDVSHLEVAPPKTGSLEDCAMEKPARPIPDTSNLSLEE